MTSTVLNLVTLLAVVVVITILYILFDPNAAQLITDDTEIDALDGEAVKSFCRKIDVESRYNPLFPGGKEVITGDYDRYWTFSPDCLPEPLQPLALSNVVAVHLRYMPAQSCTFIGPERTMFSSVMRSERAFPKNICRGKCTVNFHDKRLHDTARHSITYDPMRSHQIRNLTNRGCWWVIVDRAKTPLEQSKTHISRTNPRFRATLTASPLPLLQGRNNVMYRNYWHRRKQTLRIREDKNTYHANDESIADKKYDENITDSGLDDSELSCQLSETPVDEDSYCNPLGQVVDGLDGLDHDDHEDCQLSIL